MEFIDNTKATMIGTSLYARIPAPTCKSLGIVKGTELNIYRDGDNIVFNKNGVEPK